MLAQIDKPGYIEETASLNLRDAGLQFAFHIEGMNPRYTKNDPRYIKMITRIFGRQNGERYEKVFQPHICTEADLKNF